MGLGQEMTRGQFGATLSRILAVPGLYSTFIFDKVKTKEVIKIVDFVNIFERVELVEGGKDGNKVVSEFT